MKLHLNKIDLNDEEKNLFAYFNLDKNRLNQHITNYNQIIRGKYRKSVPWSSLDTWNKITDEHVNSIEKYSENNHNRRVTVSQIRKFMDWSWLKRTFDLKHQKNTQFF